MGTELQRLVHADSVGRDPYEEQVVPAPLFEETQRAIFLAAHGEPWDAQAIAAIVRRELGAKPATLDGDADETKRFFRQHVALELVFHLHGAGVEVEALRALLEPFLASPADHVQISAARALGALPGPATLERLCSYLEEPRPGFAKVMAVWALRDLGSAMARTCLRTYRSRAEEDELGFGIGLIDPRVGTVFPGSVAAAIDEAAAASPRSAAALGLALWLDCRRTRGATR